MKMNWPILSAVALIFACNANAQRSTGEQVKEARIKMLAAAVSFLTADSTFKTKYTNFSSTSKVEILDFIRKNNLTKADTYINRLDFNIKIDTTGNWKAGLEIFKDSIEHAFFHGADKEKKNDKSYRKERYKDAYAAYQKKIKEAIDAVKPPAAAPAEAPAATPAAGEEVKQPKTKQPKEGTYKASNVEKTESDPLVTPLFLYLVIALLAIASAYLFIMRRKGSKDKNNSLRIKYEEKKEEIEELKKAGTEKDRKIKTLTREFDELKVEHEKIKVEKDNMEKMIEKNKKKEEGKVAGIDTVNGDAAVKGAKKQSQDVIASRAPEIRYAHYADGGNGFLEGNLQEQPDNETIFEITITSADTATFVVSGNSTVQRYAISNTDYFLSKACKYDSFPSYQPNGISTDSPGMLRKENSKWIIVAHAEISFS